MGTPNGDRGSPGRLRPCPPPPLAGTPGGRPAFSVETADGAGGTDVLADPRAVRSLVLLMNQHAVQGGAAAHWGGPAGFVEIMASLHGIMFRGAPGGAPGEWHERWNFVNDAGHCENGIYALRALYGFGGLSFADLRGFRSIDSRLTGHGEAHLYPEGVYVSNGPLGSGIGQAQGLAFADRVLGNRRPTVCAVTDGACMEGEAKECLASIPGLARKGRVNPFLLLVSFNDAKLSGRIGADSFTMEETFRALEPLGWDVAWVEAGNDLDRVHPALHRAAAGLAEAGGRPRAVVFRTVKGAGVRSAEEAPDGGHGHPFKAGDPGLADALAGLWDGDVPGVFADWARELVPGAPSGGAPARPPPRARAAGGAAMEKTRDGISRALLRAGRAGLPVVSLSSDLHGSTGAGAFHREFPGRSLDLGVAESNMVSMGAGASKQGLVAVVDTFSQFGATKGNLPLLMSALSKAPVIGLFSHAGFQAAADGASHQATTYIALTASIPSTVLVVCGCAREAEAYLDQALGRLAARTGGDADSVLFFYGRESQPAHYGKGPPFEWGRPQLLAEGGDGMIVACGPLVAEAMRARDLLAEDGFSAAVVNHPFVNRVDADFFGDLLAAGGRGGGRLVTMEDHQATGGMGSILVSELAQAGLRPAVRILGVRGAIGRSAYLSDHLHRAHGLDAKAARRALLSLA